MNRSGGSSDAESEGSDGEAKLVDIAWVARRLGVSERHVRRLVTERRIPYIKWGHLLRFDPDEIEAWIDKRRRQAAS